MSRVYLEEGVCPSSCSYNHHQSIVPYAVGIVAFAAVAVLCTFAVSASIQPARPEPPSQIHSRLREIIRPDAATVYVLDGQVVTEGEFVAKVRSVHSIQTNGRRLIRVEGKSTED